MTTLISSDANAAVTWKADELATAATVGPVQFHVFLGAHSLLIGLLPFYLPVWMWRNGIGLDGLALLIAVSGFSFAAALSAWQRIGQQRSTAALVSTSFVLEVVLVVVAITASTLLVDTESRVMVWLIAAVIGLSAGVYNAFFWTTQRVLFAASLGANDAGKRYGNFQIYVAVLLKVGIVVGGLLLDHNLLLGLFAVSALICLASALWLKRRLPSTPLLVPSRQDHTHDFEKDTRSRSVFLADGVFLLLESHFWTLSLFLLFGEDFTRLGVLVVLLGIAFALLFWASKNLVDRLAVRQVYVIAVVLYGASWWLRSVAGELEGPSSTGVLLIVVTFTTSFFRLGFNKRFFEHAINTSAASYLVWKSRVSQRALGIVFLGIALGLAISPGVVAHSLSTVYLVAAVGALTYLLYPSPAARPD